MDPSWVFYIKKWINRIGTVTCNLGGLRAWKSSRDGKWSAWAFHTPLRKLTKMAPCLFQTCLPSNSGCKNALFGDDEWFRDPTSKSVGKSLGPSLQRSGIKRLLSITWYMFFGTRIGGFKHLWFSHLFGEDAWRCPGWLIFFEMGWTTSYSSPPESHPVQDIQGSTGRWHGFALKLVAANLRFLGKDIVFFLVCQVEVDLNIFDDLKQEMVWISSWNPISGFKLVTQILSLMRFYWFNNKGMVNN